MSVGLSLGLIHCLEKNLVALATYYENELPAQVKQELEAQNTKPQEIQPNTKGKATHNAKYLAIQ